MNIKDIEYAIQELEQSPTSKNNVEELACLYIVRNNISNDSMPMVNDEFHDILPAYRKYCNIKGNYQLGNTTEEAVLNSLQLLCQELAEFIQTLYCNTDLRKERILIEKVLSNQYNQFCNS